MDPWPADERQNQSSSKSKGKGNNPTTPNYPLLALGSNVATLTQQKNGRFQWTYAIDEQARPKRQCGQPALLFPATRPSNPPVLEVPVQQRAEQGANFLRIHFPDVDVPAELIRETLVEDAKLAAELEAFDPYDCNLLDLLLVPKTGSQQVAPFLAFPMGELNVDLNISPLILSHNCLTFIPSPVTRRSFRSPIRQIASLPKIDARTGSTHLAVRTYGTTEIIELQMDLDDSDVVLSDVAAFSRSKTGNNFVVDVGVLYSNPAGLMLATDCGTVYITDLSEPGKAMFELRPSGEVPHDKFWRLASCETNSNAFLLASSVELSQCDSRSGRFSSIMKMKDGKEFLTSASYSANAVLLSTTKQLLCIDDRMPARPLFGYSHGRQFDRSLNIQTVDSNDSTLIFLSSRKNDLTTIYDVTRSSGLMQFNASPYCLPSVNGEGVQYPGRACLSGFLDEGAVTLFSLAQNGSLHARNAFPATQTEPLIRAQISPEVMELGNRVSSLNHSRDSLESYEITQVDFSPVYEKLFRDPDFVEQLEEEQATAVYDLLEQIPHSWQSEIAPVDHMLTTYDITLRAGEEPQSATRSDFFSSNLIRSKRGYRALKQGRLAPTTMKHDGWHHDLRPTLQRLGVDVSDDITTLTEQLQEYDQVLDPDRSAQLSRRESDAREQLALDLTLASDVFADRSITSPEDNFDLESRAGALSLNGEPPSVSLSFLRPVPKNEKYTDHKGGEEFVAPLGVRLLLKDWDVGADPKDYEYRDPYNKGEEQSQSSPKASGGAPQPIKSQQRAALPSTQRPKLPTQLPPSILPSVTLQPPKTRTLETPQTKGHNQVPEYTYRTIHSSQPSAVSRPASASVDMASTQVLPGPFGGRQTVSKKKTAKRRLGGF